MILHKFLPNRLIFIILQCFLTTLSTAEDIIGCGGFVKSDIDISKAQVKVKLYTKQGSLKDQTECAPKNGYYFLPLYDKGDYVLKIEPPKGWTFDPQEVPLSFDGVSDPCSQNKDINFEFKGFSIYGKVVSAGSATGPEGVAVHLVKDKTEVAKTVTGNTGVFEFLNVRPGVYTVRGSHPKWQVSSTEVPISVSNGNGNVKIGSLVVSGYDVSGTVLSDGEPMKGVNFVLFQLDAKAGSPIPTIDGCSRQALHGFKPSGPLDKNIRQVCHVQSDSDGKFSFDALAPGRYRVEPFYQGAQNLRFELEPKTQEFTVTHNSVVLPGNFNIKGFTVSGRVLFTSDGPGVPHAYVLVNNKMKAETDKYGYYQLDGVQSGTYTIEAASDKLRFSSVDVKISPSMAHLPDLIPWGFEVCGRITPPRLEDNRPRTVLLSSDKTFSQIISRAEADSAGLYCFHLKSGTYYTTVQMSPEEKTRGLQYAPLIREVKVVDHPISVGQDFSQLKARVHGRVKCIKKCTDIGIQLSPLSPGSSVQATKLKDDGTFELHEVLLGGYRVSVIREDWCWEIPQHEIEVAAADVTVPTFNQVGFGIDLHSSHETNVMYELITEQKSSQPVKNTIPVKRGLFRICVPVSGTYRLEGIGCHVFADQGKLMYNTDAPTKPVMLTAIGHTITGWIESEKTVNDLFMRIEKSDGTLVERQGPLVAKQEAGKWHYGIKVLTMESEEYRIVPESALLLFKPKETIMQRHTDCVEGAVKIQAIMGQVISGEVVPPFSGVTITVSVEGNTDSDFVIQKETDDKGHFRVGPLQPGLKYRVTAEKEGYVMTGPDDKNRFMARKLAEVVAFVSDRADGSPLQGVLLSLSGGSSYRRNSQTGADGQMSFKSLSPGDYYLKPMLKEYRFEPSALQFEVKEGDTVNLKLGGDRVAVSAYGVVMSLSKEPEAGVLVEAIGVDREGHQCSHLQEEAFTEVSGQFRIRGLQPQCNYIVRVKPDSETNKHISRATPESIPLQAVEADVKNLKLTAFRPITKTEVITVVRPTADAVEHLRSVKLKLCSEESPESPIHVVKLDSVIGTQGKQVFEYYPAGVVVHFPSVPADGRGYFVQLESSISPSFYEFNNQVNYFQANTSFRYVPLTFNPKPRFVEQEMNQGSMLLLPLVIFVLVSYFGREQIVPVLKKVIEGGFSLRKSFGDSSGSSDRSNTRPGSREKNNQRERDITPDGSDGATVELVGKKKTKPRRT